MDIPELIKQSGVVGAGGGGFPAHVKAEARVDYVIANGAECEPLIHKDCELMLHRPEDVVEGVRLLMKATGARQGIIGIKEKNKRAIEAITAVIGSSNIRVHTLGDFYPSGDEFILVYEATGRLIPPLGIPPAVGVVVSNVETLRNIARAVQGKPVTEKFITVAGAVRRPATYLAPVGMSFREAIAIVGGSTVKEYAVFSGGIMMGGLHLDVEAPITKTCAGLVVLPVEHNLVQRKRQPESSMNRIGKSACDQCSFCTELCPRYILGYDVQPHKVMRSLVFTKSGEQLWNQYAMLCCACGLCTLYACPESLFPKEACDRSKADLKKGGVAWSGRKEVTPHQMYEGRRAPLKQLIRRLGIEAYDHPSEYREVDCRPENVSIPLLQHAGGPATPIVKVGQRVRKGEMIGEIPSGKLGAAVHASMDGIVRRITDAIVIGRD